MNFLKSLLAAMFVSEVGYILAILISIGLRFGYKSHTAIGTSIFLLVVMSTLALLIWFASFLVSLWLFLRK